MEKIIFEDLPSTKTPLNANNLNQLQANIEAGIKEAQEKIEKTIDGIIENGSNDNGTYIKFADGTMICTGTKSFTGEADYVQDGSIYYKDVGEYTFPMEFIESPIVNITSANDNYTRHIWIGGIANISTSQIGHINVCTNWNATAGGGKLHIQAIGKWK